MTINAIRTLCLALFTLLLLASCADHPRKDYHRAMAILGEGGNGAAEAILLDDVQRHPDRPETWNQLGILAFERGEFETARERFGMARQLDRLHPAYARNLAMALAELGDTARAARLLEKSIELDPADPATRVALAKALILGGDREAAAAAVQDALERDPADPEALELMEFLSNGG